ncbi:K(+)-transporting ATPase subunit F [Paenibacillus hemerocallicola]|uniref:K(+)-transporting ATPase subunit F n=1 Tax=Paenibacillus hemerocallicola TaxID=1172614 RepID=A0A5C4SYU8_9BACL|nr:K(+)-transporting ATPase subunit F [Paenibacillus hemerocallicola]
MRKDRGGCGRRAQMIVVFAFTLFIFVYLVYALINPEKF